MTEQKDGSVLYAVYGTLRKNWGNNRLLNNQYSEYLGTMKTEPIFTLYHLGGFPAVAEEGTTAVTVEIWRVTDKATASRINGLEGYSGIRGAANNWYDTVEIETEWGTANMFTMNKMNESSHRIIETGDWNNQVFNEEEI